MEQRMEVTHNDVFFLVYACDIEMVYDFENAFEF